MWVHAGAHEGSLAVHAGTMAASGKQISNVSAVRLLRPVALPILSTPQSAVLPNPVQPRLACEEKRLRAGLFTCMSSAKATGWLWRGRRSLLSWTLGG